MQGDTILKYTLTIHVSRVATTGQQTYVLLFMKYLLWVHSYIMCKMVIHEHIPYQTHDIIMIRMFGCVTFINVKENGITKCTLILSLLAFFKILFFEFFLLHLKTITTITCTFVTLSSVLRLIGKSYISCEI